MKTKYIILLVLVVIIVAWDQWTKMLVLDSFRWGETVPVIEGFFNLTYVRNTGAAFGFLAKSHPDFRVPFFLVVPFLALIIIGMVFNKLPAKSRWMSTALALVVGGAVGNLIDRVRLGYVVDFLDFHWKFGYHFPAFNVADSAICVGVGMLILDLFIHGNEKKKSEQKKVEGKSSASDPV